jgi:pimeloyl-ACP methyl ester carboxylesterase
MGINSPDVIRSGAELVHPLVDPDERAWLVARDISEPLVVFVHGFTSHGRYLVRLADYVSAHGFVSALFNYDSYQGINHAAEELEHLLDAVADGLTERGFFLVGHSMGGLVARYFAAQCSAAWGTALRGVATLGTPHRGTLSRKLVSRLLDWADFLTGPNPFARSPACRSAQQLADASPAGLIASLNAREPRTDLQYH